ncbi:MAG: diguanylate cyclase [Lachnospiraceae bacterium]|nr:diguanylate cyclase [Lachnospiraceae bacterium]
MFIKRAEGISHRKVHIVLIIIIVIFSGTVVFSTAKLTSTFMRITSASKQNSELRNAANELMSASDYLTEQVQRFTIDGEVKYMEEYFTEAFESQRREAAIAKMDVDDRTDAALTHLQTAMAESVDLMDKEYYAMRLVIAAKGYANYPELLKGVKLSLEDLVLPSDEKMRRATELVLSEEYYEQKDAIRREVQESLVEVNKISKNIEENELESLRHQMRIVRAAIVIQAAFIFFTLWLTSRLAINPLFDAVDRIKEDSPISENGSNEFNYLARAYNKMYEKNKSSFERLNYKASHDELTGAYNRAGYDYLLANIDLSSTYMMLFDVDNFKSINDTYGHETGDKVLIKIVNILKSIFRDDDCICRIGGDEFVIFIMHSSSMQRRLIESKISQINTELENTDDGLPPVTISIGIVNGKDVKDTEHIFEKTDAAMYESKKSGKNTYTFYENPS